MDLIWQTRTIVTASGANLIMMTRLLTFSINTYTNLNRIGWGMRVTVIIDPAVSRKRIVLIVSQVTIIVWSSLIEYIHEYKYLFFRAERTACTICYSALSPGLGIGRGGTQLLGKKATAPTSLVFMFTIIFFCCDSCPISPNVRMCVWMLGWLWWSDKSWGNMRN